MSPRKFDRFLVDVEAGRNLKIGRLTDSERCAFFLGVLAIAAKSPIRGRLLVGDLVAEPRDVAKQASVADRVAASAMDKLRALGVLLPDPEFGCETVHDFEDWNPPPKADATAGERQARRRAKLKESRDSHGSVTLASRRDARDIPVTVTPPEVEGEVEVTPLAPQGGNNEPFDGEHVVAPAKPSSARGRDLTSWKQQHAAWVAEHFPGCDPKPVASLVEWVRSRGTDPTPAAIREFAAAAPAFAHALEPVAA
jgi:hypothetical protein